MKALRIILFVILVLVVVFIILGFLGPKTFDSKRSVEIDAPVELVYEQFSDLGNLSNWDPWKEENPGLEFRIEGSPNEVGGYRMWEGEGMKGKEILKSLESNREVVTEVILMEPEHAPMEGYYLVEEREGGCRATIGMRGENAFWESAMTMLGMDADDYLGPLYEKGCASLKEIAETAAKAQSEARAVAMDNTKFEMVEMPQRYFLAKRKVLSFDEMESFYQEEIKNMSMALAASGITPSNPFDIIYRWDVEAQETDMCAAMAINDPDLQIEGYETLTFEQGRAIRYVHQGPYEGLAEAHSAIGTYMTAKAFTQSQPTVQEYLNSPLSEADPAKLLTHIYYYYK